eukprot:228721-Heterocapsa_arctica.AAC.1
MRVAGMLDKGNTVVFSPFGSYMIKPRTPWPSGRKQWLTTGGHVNVIRENDVFKMEMEVLPPLPSSGGPGLPPWR